MKYPQLVPDMVCSTPVSLKLNSEDLDRYGQPQEILNIDTKCNYQCTAQRTIEDKEIIIKTVATLLFNGDIAPMLDEITSGEVIINGETRQIEKGSKVRNPDGTVNYTRIYLK